MPHSTSPQPYSPPVSPHPKNRRASPSPLRAPQWHDDMLREFRVGSWLLFPVAKGFCQNAAREVRSYAPGWGLRCAKGRYWPVAHRNYRPKAQEGASRAPVWRRAATGPLAFARKVSKKSELLLSL